MGGKGQQGKGSGNGLPRNNKNRPAGSGTTSHARRERVRAAAQARDKAKEEEEKAKKEEQRVKDEEEKKMMDKKKEEENQNMKDKKKEEEDKQVSLDKREIVEDKKAPLDKREAAEDKKISLDKRESAKELGPSDTQKEKDTWADMLKRKKEWQPKSAAAAASTASNFPPLPKGSTPAKAPCQKEEPAASDKKETPCQKESTQKSSSSSSSESVSCDWGGSSSDKSSTASNPKKKKQGGWHKLWEGARGGAKRASNTGTKAAWMGGCGLVPDHWVKKWGHWQKVPGRAQKGWLQNLGGVLVWLWKREASATKTEATPGWRPGARSQLHQGANWGGWQSRDPEKIQCVDHFWRQWSHLQGMPATRDECLPNWVQKREVVLQLPAGCCVWFLVQAWQVSHTHTECPCQKGWPKGPAIPCQKGLASSCFNPCQKDAWPKGHPIPCQKGFASSWFHSCHNPLPKGTHLSGTNLQALAKRVMPDFVQCTGSLPLPKGLSGFLDTTSLNTQAADQKIN